MFGEMKFELVEFHGLLKFYELLKFVEFYDFVEMLTTARRAPDEGFY